MKQRRTFSLVLVAAATLLASLTGTSTASASSSQSDSSQSDWSRSGTLRITKDCTGFSGNPYPQSFCVITASNLNVIPLNSKVLYLQPTEVATPAGSDVILDPPGNSSGRAFGHCALVASEDNAGVCTFSGGTKDFKGFHATVVVAHQGGVLYSWTGTYAFEAGCRR